MLNREQSAERLFVAALELPPVRFGGSVNGGSFSVSPSPVTPLP